MHVRATGIDVVITGDPKIVRNVLEAVRGELERRPRRRAAGGDPRILGGPDTDSQVVLPTDLDEMDSPYAIPEHRPAKKIPEPPKAKTQLASDSDIVASVDDKTMDEVPEQKTLEVNPSASGRIPLPEIQNGPPERITQPDSVGEIEAFEDVASDRGTDPDLELENNFKVRR